MLVNERYITNTELNKCKARPSPALKMSANKLNHASKWKVYN